MFNSAWKEQVLDQLRDLESQIGDLRKGEGELKAQTSRLQNQIKNLGKKLALRLPVSIESLEKGLPYDLLFSDEVDLWLQAARGVIVDLRSTIDFQAGTVSGAVNIPFENLAQKVDTISRDTALLLVCDNGIKSASASELLMTKGFSYLYVLKGGYALYRQAHDRLQATVH